MNRARAHRVERAFAATGAAARADLLCAPRRRAFMEIALVLALLVLASVAFARELLPVDLVAALLLLALLFSGLLTPEEAFAGFGSDVIIVLASVFVLTGAMRETGVVEWAGQSLAAVCRFGGYRSLLTGLMAVVGALSAFMNNTTVTALMVGPASWLARERHIAASRVLMPLAFASILGGTCTLMGTSTNLAVSGFLSRMNVTPIGFFELAPLGIVLVAAGIAGMVLLGPWLLPDTGSSNLQQSYGLEKYLSEVVVLSGGQMDARTLRQAGLGDLDIRVLEILRDGSRLRPHPDFVLAGGDLLLVNAAAESLMKVRDVQGLEIHPEEKFGARDLRDSGEILEVLVTPQSELAGRMISELDLPARLGISVLAVNRHGRNLREKLKSIRLRTGDLLLVLGPKGSMDELRTSPDFAVFGERSPVTNRTRKAWIVASLLGAAVIASAAGWLPLSVSMLAAAAGSVLFRALPPQKVYDAIDWRVIVLVAGMTAFGVAMQKSGTSAFLAQGIASTLAPFGGHAVLAAFVLLTVILTQPLSNAAAALVVLPVAMTTAETLGLNPRSFAIAIAYGASISLVAPFEPSCLLVYGPGKYRLGDFLRAGGLLTLVLVGLVIALVPVFWPLR